MFATTAVKENAQRLEKQERLARAGQFQELHSNMSNGMPATTGSDKSQRSAAGTRNHDSH